MIDGKVKGYFLVGENPAVGTSNGRMQRLGLANLDWLVVRDLVMIESATFWKDGPEIETGEMATDDIGTEVFFLPAAAHTEKGGTFTNTQRLLQWHHKAVEPPGDATSDLWFYYHLGAASRRSWPAPTDPMDRPVLDLTWDYPEEGRDRRARAREAVLREINGIGPDGEARSPPTPSSRPTARRRAAAGSTAACTATRSTSRRGASRREQSWVAPRVGLGVAGQPPDPVQPRLGGPRRQAVERAQGLRLVGRREGKWTGHDVPDFIPDREPHHVPAEGATGPDAIGGTRPVHHADRRQGVAVRPGRPRRRTAADATTSRRSHRCATRLRAAEATRRASTTTTPVNADEPVRQRRLPVRLHDVPADRAPHGRWHEPDAAVPVRAAARVLLRGVAAAGRGAGPGAPGLGDDRHRPGRDRGPGPRDRADAAAAAGRPSRAPGRPALPLGRHRADHRRLRQRPGQRDGRPERQHPGQGRHLRHPAGSPTARARRSGLRRGVPRPRGVGRTDQDGGGRRHDGRNRLHGPLRDVTDDAGYADPPPRMGFFTDTSICIGCKACEVACKQWNGIPEDGLLLTGMSYDNTSQLDANSWRHVAFIEQSAPIVPVIDQGRRRRRRRPRHRSPTSGCRRSGPRPAEHRATNDAGIRWLMSSDVCKHCTHAACLDVCPTGALFRTEFGTVVVQADVCNGCGYCVPACPYGVIDQRKEDGRVFKCTMCYDRLKVGEEPACAKACPTDSIQFGELDELRERADRRVAELHAQGVDVARLYGHDPDDGVGGDGAFFLLLDEPEVYGLPPDPVVTTRDLPSIWKHVGAAALTLVGRRRRLRREAPVKEPRHGARAPSPSPTTAGRSSRRPAWKQPDVPLYLFLGGVAGASAVLAEGAALTGPARPANGSRGSRPPAVRPSAPSRWCTTSAGRSGSSTCCGCSSRRRRSRWARGSWRRSAGWRRRPRAST